MTTRIRMQRQVANDGIISSLRHCHDQQHEPDHLNSGGGDNSNSYSSSISTSNDDNNNTDFVTLDTTVAATEGNLDIIEKQVGEEEEHHLHRDQESMKFHYFGTLYSGLRKRHVMSLSQSTTTPCLLRWMVPLLSLCTHGLFLYCQLAPMWRLHLSVHVDNAWANATSFESQYVFNTIGITLVNHISINQEINVKEFSFLVSITDLWNAVGSTQHRNKLIIPRIAAILIIACSGVWPHLKLILLQWTWYTESCPQRRTRLLHWLSILGKWSLANILAICIMMGILHLDYIMDSHTMKHGVMHNLTLLLNVVQTMYGKNAQDICSAGLAPLNCHHHHSNKHQHYNHHHRHHWEDWGKCQACITLVELAMDHPETTQRSFQSVLNGVQVSGNGMASLRVQGMHGIYAFCWAVIVSIFISLLVDIVDVRSHNNHHHGRALLGDHDETETDQEEEEEIILLQPSHMSNRIMAMTSRTLDVNHHGVDSINLEVPLLFLHPPEKTSITLTDLSDGGARRQNHRHHGPPLRLWAPPPVNAIGCRRCIRYWSLLTSTGLTFCIVVTAIWYPTTTRVVTGAIPQVLGKVLGVSWDHSQPYSLYNLVQMTDAAGGFDYLLMATFGLFVVAGPVIRALLCVLAALTNTTSATTSSGSSSRRCKLLLDSIELIGAFCAWEVFVAAAFMVSILIPTISSAIITKPQCAKLDREDGSCLQVEFQLQDYFVLLLLGGSLLLFLANTKFRRARNSQHYHSHQHVRSSPSESSAAFEYSMVVQSESSDPR